MTSPSILESRDLALELHRAFSELDRGLPFGAGRRRVQRVTERLAELGRRIAAWLETTHAERESEALASVGFWREVHRALAVIEPSSGLDRSALVALRTRVQPSYEAIVRSLAEKRLSVPSLRPTNYARNALHVASAVSGIVALETVPNWTWATGIALGVALVGWTMELTRRRSASVNRFCMRLFGPTAHPHEAHGVNSATWYATSVVLLSLTQALVPCLVALCVLGVGDPAAAIVGRRFGRFELAHGRTVEGTLAFVLAGAGTAFAYLLAMHEEIPWPLALTAALGGALAGAVAEVTSRRVDDNLSIPLAACAGAALGGWVASAAW